MLECTTTLCSCHITLLCDPRRAHVTCFKDKPINFPELAQHQTPKMCSKAQSCAESQCMSPVLMHAHPFLHLGGVSMQKQLCGQLVCSKSACDRHVTNSQSCPHAKAPTRKESPTTHIWSQSASKLASLLPVSFWCLHFVSLFSCLILVSSFCGLPPPRGSGVTMDDCPNLGCSLVFQKSRFPLRLSVSGGLSHLPGANTRTPRLINFCLCVEIKPEKLYSASSVVRPLPFNHSRNRNLFFRKNNFGIDASI